MASNYVLLRRIELSQSAASVTFSNIPQSGYTDLKVVTSARSDYDGAGGGSNIRDNLNFYFNGLAASGNWSGRQLYGIPGIVTGSGSWSSGNSGTFGYSNGTGNTTISYGSCELYIPNYTSSQFKSASSEGMSESNASSTGLSLNANLYSSTSAITSITIFSGNGANLVAGSTFSLYGIAAVGSNPEISPYASGGSSVTTDGTYWYHTFLSSGTFRPSKSLSCDYLVVAGGGGGGSGLAGGGAGGGFRTSSAVSFASSTSHTIAVGAGGAAGPTLQSVGYSGGSSSISGSGFTTFSSSGGGGGGGIDQNGASGGSGGGGGGSQGGDRPGGAGNTGSYSPVEGYAGGKGVNGGSPYHMGGGGGGASIAGTDATTRAGGAGGNGAANSYSGSSVTYAGGGGGAGRKANSAPGGAGGSGGGGGGAGSNLTNATAGTANLGGGGGGGDWQEGSSNYFGAAGGSGIVIIRYAI